MAVLPSSEGHGDVGSRVNTGETTPTAKGPHTLFIEHRVVSRFQRHHLLDAAVGPEAHDKQRSASPAPLLRLGRVGDRRVNGHIFHHLLAGRVQRDRTTMDRKRHRHARAPLRAGLAPPVQERSPRRVIEQLMPCRQDRDYILHRPVWSKAQSKHPEASPVLLRGFRGIVWDWRYDQAIDKAGIGVHPWPVRSLRRL